MISHARTLSSCDLCHVLPLFISSTTPGRRHLHRLHPGLSWNPKSCTVPPSCCWTLPRCAVQGQVRCSQAHCIRTYVCHSRCTHDSSPPRLAKQGLRQRGCSRGWQRECDRVAHASVCERAAAPEQAACTEAHCQKERLRVHRDALPKRKTACTQRRTANKKGCVYTKAHCQKESGCVYTKVHCKKKRPRVHRGALPVVTLFSCCSASLPAGQIEDRLSGCCGAERSVQCGPRQRPTGPVHALATSQGWTHRTQLSLIHI